MKKITLTLLLSATCVLQAQTFEWLKTPPITFSSNPDMIGYATAHDPSGNVYLSGFKENSFNYSEIFGDVFYNKYDDAGNLQFSKTFTGHVTVYDMVSDSQGNIIVAAGFVNLFAVDDLSIDIVDQGVQNLVLKFNSNGELLWHKQMSIENSFECRVHTITVDASDNVYIGYYDFMDSFIKKLSPQGDTLATIPQLNARSVQSISIDSEGNIYAAGSCADPGATFAGVTVSPSLLYNTFIVKYTANGVYQWVRYVEDITCPEPQVFAHTPDEVYFCSYLFDNYTFDGIPTEGPQQMFSDIFITKLNAAGNFQWVREVPGSGYINTGNRKFLSGDAQGNVYFAGSMRGTINWNNQMTTASNGFSNEAIVLKYNPQGDLLLAKTAGGASTDRFDAVTVNADGDIFLTGMSNGSASFDGIQHEIAQFQNWPFLAKLNMTALGTSEQDLGQVVIYPNPTSDFIRISNTTQNHNGNIFNMLGQKVMDFEISSDKPVAVHPLPTGTYLIKLNQSRSIKFVKN